MPTQIERAESIIELLSEPRFSDLGGQPLLAWIACQPDVKPDNIETPTQLLEIGLMRVVSLRNREIESERDYLDHRHLSVLAEIALQHLLADVFDQTTLSAADARKAIRLRLRDDPDLAQDLEWVNDDAVGRKLLGHYTTRSGLFGRSEIADSIWPTDLRFYSFLAGVRLAELADEFGWHDEMGPANGDGLATPCVQVTLDDGKTHCLTVGELVSRLAWSDDERTIASLGHMAARMAHPEYLIDMLRVSDPTPLNPHGDCSKRHRLWLALAVREAATRPSITTTEQDLTDTVVERVVARKRSKDEYARLSVSRSAMYHAVERIRSTQETSRYGISPHHQQLLAHIAPCADGELASMALELLLNQATKEVYGSQQCLDLVIPLVESGSLGPVPLSACLRRIEHLAHHATDPRLRVTALRGLVFAVRQLSSFDHSGSCEVAMRSALHDPQTTLQALYLTIDLESWDPVDNTINDWIRQQSPSRFVGHGLYCFWRLLSCHWPSRARVDTETILQWVQDALRGPLDEHWSASHIKKVATLLQRLPAVNQREAVDVLLDKLQTTGYKPDIVDALVEIAARRSSTADYLANRVNELGDNDAGVLRHDHYTCARLLYPVSSSARDASASAAIERSIRDVQHSGDDYEPIERFANICRLLGPVISSQQLSTVVHELIVSLGRSGEDAFMRRFYSTNALGEIATNASAITEELVTAILNALESSRLFDIEASFGERQVVLIALEALCPALRVHQRERVRQLVLRVVVDNAQLSPRVAVFAAYHALQIGAAISNGTWERLADGLADVIGKGARRHRDNDDVSSTTWRDDGNIRRVTTIVLCHALRTIRPGALADRICRIALESSDWTHDDYLLDHGWSVDAERVIGVARAVEGRDSLKMYVFEWMLERIVHGDDQSQREVREALSAMGIRWCPRATWMREAAELVRWSKGASVSMRGKAAAHG